jgi:Delta3-Delta2-enoyl-CoA isomerase
MNSVQLSLQDDVACVRIERGKVNALEDGVVEELATCFRQIAEDERVRGTILTGAGKFFSFGFDITHFLAYPKASFVEYLGRFTALYRELFAHPKPVVAAINGHAVAGGCMLACACDARLMVDGSAKIGLNEIGFGSSVFAGSVAMLAFWVGGRRAQEILYAGTLYPADDALALGLVDAVVPGETLLDAARQVVREHASKEARAFASIKQLLRRPVIAQMLAHEEASIREFADIWYSDRTWRNLQEIRIR